MRAAYIWADSLYFANIEGHYTDALVCADSAFSYINRFMMLAGYSVEQRLNFRSDDFLSEPVEVNWCNEGVDMDYSLLLGLRNETAIAALGCRDWLCYYYNNSVYNNTLYETDKYIPNFNIHDYGSLIYTRRNYFDADYYVEIKGKSIFEFLYYEKPVFYNAKPKTIDDGLTDYIRYFGIDDNITQELKIPKDVIYEKLIYFDDNDLVMKLLCE